MSDKRSLVENFFSLSSLQVVNYIVPLITIPYLTRVLGPEKFGLLAFAQTFVLYFFLVTNYGFNLSATREISTNRDDMAKVNRIVSKVFIIQFGLILTSFFIMAVLCVYIPKVKNETMLFIAAFSAVLGNVFFPVWFFQGMEKMREISIFNAIGKALFLLLLLLLVRNESDYVMAAWIYSLGLITSAIISMIFLFGVYKVKVVFPSLHDIRIGLKDGWHVFISTFTMSFYASTNTVILGFFAPDAIVGYYNAGEKIIRAIQGLFSPLTQTIYPHISRLASESKDSTMRFISRITGLGGMASLLTSLFLLFFASQITRFILGEKFTESVIVLQILSFYPFFSLLNNIFSIQIMLNFGLQKLFSRIVIMTSLINLVVALFLVIPLGHKGVALSLLLAEVFMVSISSFSLYARGFRLTLLPIKKMSS